MKKKNNPVAKELMTPQYKPRVKESRKTYRRDWELEEDVLDEGDFVIDGYDIFLFIVLAKVSSLAILFLLYITNGIWILPLTSLINPSLLAAFHLSGLP